MSRFWAISTAVAIASLGSKVGFGSEEVNGDAVIVHYQSSVGAQSQGPDYWTPERRAVAVPIDMGVVTLEAGESGQAVQMTVDSVPSGPPMIVPGWSGSGPMPSPDAWQEVSSTDDSAAISIAPMSYGSIPTNPLSGPYGPFQRFAMHGKYKIWPRSIHGKLFFTRGGGFYVCSGTVVGKSLVITAGHCLSDGAGTFSTNLLFCPGYTNGAENPFMGCYSVVGGAVMSDWHSGGDIDYDYACLVTDTTGTVVNDVLGVATGGWAGVGTNFIDVPVMTFGYPANLPFDGNEIQQTASVMWYQSDSGAAGGQVSNAIGSDLTGGSSGGGWFISWHAPGNEIPDQDGSFTTDPAEAGLDGPYIIGVNSHSRCAVNCNTPPTATEGLFWQEMISPPFLDDAGTSNDFSDLYDLSDCSGHANNL